MPSRRAGARRAERTWHRLWPTRRRGSRRRPVRPTTSTREGDGTSWVTFPTALSTPHHGKQHRPDALFPGPRDRGDRSASRGARPAAMELRCAGPRRALPAARAIRDERASPQPALSRRAHAARARRAPTTSSARTSIRTLEVCRQAVLDARRAIQWLAREGYERIGILGTSLGSCLSMLTTCHEPLVSAQALNHISPYFADVVWRGLSTRHVGRLERAHHAGPAPRGSGCRSARSSISIGCAGRDVKTLLVYARYDLTFPVDLSRDLVDAFRDKRVPFQLSVLPCGHYSTGSAPFKYLDGAVLTRFLYRQSSVVGS